jgi:hypothetical protein
MTRWTSSPAISGQRIPISSTRLTARPRRCTIPGAWAWGSGPKGEAPVYTGVDFIVARDGKIAALYVYLDSPPA